MKCNFCAALLHFISKCMNSACYFGENNFIPFFSLFVFTALILQGFKLAFERNTFEASKQFCCWLPSDLPFRQFSGKSFYFLQIKTCCFPEHVPALSTKQGKGMLNNSPIFSTLSPPNIASVTTAQQEVAAAATGRSWREERWWEYELLPYSSSYQQF